jgi:nucleolar protein 56
VDLEPISYNSLNRNVLHYIPLEFQNVDLEQSRLGLGHTFSRSKISEDVNRQDKHIVQSINLLELLDKDINTFTMRVREWYSWHYPELARIVTDNSKYVKLVKLIGVTSL